MQLVVYEWPSHGLRAEEGPSESLQALAADAFAGIRVILKDHGAGGILEGAPFAFIGHGEGAQIMTLVANHLMWEMNLEPKAVVVLDRAPPDVPLCTEFGQEVLRDAPAEFMRHYNPAIFEEFEAQKLMVGRELANKLLQTWQDDLKIANTALEAGTHFYGCPVLVARAGAGARFDADAQTAAAYSGMRFRIEGTGESITIPMRADTELSCLKGLISQQVGADPTVVAWEMAGPRDITVRGMKSFKPAPHAWPHPVGIIGAGYNGIKTGMEHMRTGDDNFVVFDRNDRVGGYCWITAANKHSKFQTEFGAVGVWWGPEFVSETYGGWMHPCDWATWTKKLDILRHFHYAAERSGMLANCHLESNVTKMDIIGDPTSHERSYELHIESLKGLEPKDIRCSVLCHFPGSMTHLRLLEYPGEREFGGQIGYGMCDDYTYDERMKGARVAILGNGAFAVENVRTCVEHAAAKVYLVTRRKNLPSPRVPCWFVHQAPFPVPARMVLDLFSIMYEVGNLGDPWAYHAVQAGADRKNVNIMQSSRFGIGDVTFIAHAYGVLEYVEDSLKKCSWHTLHLNGGRKLENVTGIIKSLGLLGDFNVDKFHSMTELVGDWPSGDYRRFIKVDPLGMNAANFTTFSTGYGTTSQVMTQKFLLDYPDEYFRVEAAGLLSVLPRSKADMSCDRPAYVTDVKYAMLSGFSLGGMLPIQMLHTKEHDPFWYALYHTIYPTDKFLTECAEDWDYYQKMMTEQGHEHEYMPYPYTREVLQPFFAEYSKVMVPITADGPSPERIAEVMQLNEECHMAAHHDQLLDRVCSKLHSGCKVLAGLNLTATNALKITERHAARARMMSSSATSGMDFDSQQYDEWEKWSRKGCEVVDFGEADHASIASDSKVWARIYAEISKVKALAPFADR
eukprot:NODE_317_length_3174_cov_16.876928.p1 GENE.NODE_317_length_3174_cov_16.876928~~NODE_317_length_3174_cov_16.876928.p1  ORF type:complete len:954 (+),score=266.73 NODE_317_length_3174_cov_16.876928:142-2862(+)